MSALRRRSPCGFDGIGSSGDGIVVGERIVAKKTFRQASGRARRANWSTAYESHLLFLSFFDLYVARINVLELAPFLLILGSLIQAYKWLDLRLVHKLNNTVAMTYTNCTRPKMITNLGKLCVHERINF